MIERKKQKERRRFTINNSYERNVRQCEWVPSVRWEAKAPRKKNAPLWWLTSTAAAAVVVVAKAAAAAAEEKVDDESLVKLPTPR